MNFIRHVLSAALVMAARLTVSGAENPADFLPKTTTPYLSAAEELKTFHVPEGYRLELVVGDPIIKEPTIAVFDGNGRMYVGEMRSYMQDIDGRNQQAPVSRVSLHWSSKNDGIFDQHTVFADKLVLPRMILPLRDGVLINETDSNDIWLYRDTDGDGVADKKELWYAGGPRGGNLEHQPSGLIWCLDNWIYTTYNAYRLRVGATNVLKEATAPNGGQWGVAQDDYGKQWFINAGGEQGPVNFQQPIVYGAFRIKDQFPPDYLEVWPLVGRADVQGGYSRFRPADNTLNHVTASCGGEIFRGDRLPLDLRGDLLYAEPVGRLIRRSKVTVRDGVTYLRNPYEKSEFIRATDPNFRPVNLVNAPDGTLYIVDMYRGIIQEGNWVREGSYLRKRVEQFAFDKNFGRGRIWRLAHNDFQPAPAPRMHEETSAQLVSHLQHPSGWWRDTAQKLLVLRGDKSVVPALREMTRTSQNHFARLHALWTLEGLDALDAPLIREKLKDEHPQVRIAAIRTSETLFKNGDGSLLPAIRLMDRDSDPSVVIQAMLTLNLLKVPDAKTFINGLVTSTTSIGIREIGKQLLAPPPSPVGAQFTSAERRVLTRGQAIYKELCFACHGPDGKGMPVDGKPGFTQAPPFAGSQTVLGHRDGMINVLLKGLTGPVQGKTYEALMVPMESNDDQWIADVTSYVRNSFGNHASMINPGDVARVRAAQKVRTEPWTPAELLASLPQPLTNQRLWKVSASHNTRNANLAIDGNPNTRFDTAVSQAPGMWFQIELPAPTLVSTIELDCAKSPRDYPRGYQVQTSDDGQTWNSPIASGNGNVPITEITFSPVKTKFIRITQTGAVNGLFWSIQELRLYQPGAPPAATTLSKKPATTFE